jgi:hypothetical protein
VQEIRCEIPLYAMYTKTVFSIIEEESCFIQSVVLSEHRNLYTSKHGLITNMPNDRPIAAIIHDHHVGVMYDYKLHGSGSSLSHSASQRIAHFSWKVNNV